MNSNIVNNDVILSNNIELLKISKKLKKQEKIQKNIGYHLVKRSMDILGGIAGIVLLFPLTLKVIVLRDLAYCDARILKLQSTSANDATSPRLQWIISR